MKVFAVLFALFAAVSAEVCYKQVEAACKAEKYESSGQTSLATCNAKYGLFIPESHIESDLQKYVNDQIEASFEYLFMSTYFGNYKKNREGFKTLYRKLSDKAWEDALDLIQFITRRGGETNFGNLPIRQATTKKEPVFDLSEFHSLAKALDRQKELADGALKLYSEAIHHNHGTKDGSVAHYVEERFMEPQAECVRNLAGYVTDLKKFFTSGAANCKDGAVSLFIFDEYLQKHL